MEQHATEEPNHTCEVTEHLPGEEVILTGLVQEVIWISHLTLSGRTWALEPAISTLESGRQH